MTPTMVTRATTLPTEISMLPVIMTIVSEQAMMIRKELSLSMSKSICGFRKPPPSTIIATAYITTKMPMVMLIRSMVSEIGSLRFMTAPPFLLLLRHYACFWTACPSAC